LELYWGIIIHGNDASNIGTEQMAGTLVRRFPPFFIGVNSFILAQMGEKGNHHAANLVLDEVFADAPHANFV